jgi:hypothetical protein
LCGKSVTRAYSSIKGYAGPFFSFCAQQTAEFYVLNKICTINHIAESRIKRLIVILALHHHVTRRNHDMLSIPLDFAFYYTQLNTKSLLRSTSTQTRLSTKFLETKFLESRSKKERKRQNFLGSLCSPNNTTHFALRWRGLVSLIPVAKHPLLSAHDPK